MNYTRDNKGRFSRGKMWLWGILFLAIVSIVCVMWISQQPRIEVTTSDVTKLEVVEKLTKEQYEAKIEQLKSDVLDDLASCESGGLKDPDGAIVLDVNGKMSIGRWMWQRESVIYYMEKLEGKKITNREAIELSVDPVRARELTARVLFGEKDGYKNWLNCANKFNLKTTIEIVNKLAL
jgi:hypothetical protein